MSSSFWLLAVGSCDLSQAEKETIACKAEKSHKNDFHSKCISFSAQDKSRDPTANSPKLENM